jgi:heme/copper-type cytochrome/quinol oxidase subunit 2
VRRRRRRRRNPTHDHSLHAIAWTIGITALTAATGAIVVYYVNKRLNPPSPPQKPALEVNVGGQWPETLKNWFNQQPPGSVA